MERLTEIRDETKYKQIIFAFSKKMVEINQKCYSHIFHKEMNKFLETIESDPELLKVAFEYGLNPSYVIYVLITDICRSKMVSLNDIERIKQRYFVDDLRREKKGFVLTYDGVEYHFTPLVTIYSDEEYHADYLSNILDNDCHMTSLMNITEGATVIDEEEFPLEDRVIKTASTSTHIKDLYRIHSFIEDEENEICYDVSHNFKMPKSEYYSLLEVDEVVRLTKKQIFDFLQEARRQGKIGDFDIRSFFIDPESISKKVGIPLEKNKQTSIKKALSPKE